MLVCNDLLVTLTLFMNHFDKFYKILYFNTSLHENRRGISSVGRAFALHAKGHGFDFRILHLIFGVACPFTTMESTHL